MKTFRKFTIFVIFMVFIIVPYSTNANIISDYIQILDTKDEVTDTSKSIITKKGGSSIDTILNTDTLLIIEVIAPVGSRSTEIKCFPKEQDWVIKTENNGKIFMDLVMKNSDLKKIADIHESELKDGNDVLIKKKWPMFIVFESKEEKPVRVKVYFRPTSSK